MHAKERVIFSKEQKEWRREAETGENQKVRTSQSLNVILQEPEFRCFTLNS
jgi:hypothetical protein